MILLEPRVSEGLRLRDHVDYYRSALPLWKGMSHSHEKRLAMFHYKPFFIGTVTTPVLEETSPARNVMQTIHAISNVLVVTFKNTKASTTEFGIVL